MKKLAAMKIRELQMFRDLRVMVLVTIISLSLVNCGTPSLGSDSTRNGTEANGELSTPIFTSTGEASETESTPINTTNPVTIAAQQPTQSVELSTTPLSTIPPSPQPTLTPFPTVSPHQRGQLYDELMTTNNGCQLPCWWGLELGKSTFEEVIQLYQQFDPAITIQEYADGYSIITILFVDPEIEDGVQTRHMLTILNGILIEAEIQVRKYERFSPTSLMQEFGQPSEVWLWTIPEPFEGVLPADFLVYYPDHGILSGYRELADTLGENVQVCLNGTGNSTLLLWNPDIWDPEGTKGFIERTNASSELTLEGHQRIEDVSNWDEEVLYTNVLDPNSTECLETPSNLWTSP